MSQPSDTSSFAAADLEPATLYRLMSGSIAPRPIAWVSTVDADGNANLAPFSFFNVASVDPPILAFAPLLDAQSQAKDTVRNIEAVPECVVHISGEALIEALNATSATLPPGEDEFTHAGLDKAPLGDLRVPRIADAPIAFGCRVREVVRFGDRPRAGRLVLAEIVVIHADPAVWDGRHVDIETLRPVGRLAGADYARVTDRFALQRPD
ncbi:MULTISPECIES: flavin reductase family protein [unclassified Modicisalibacter]|uniref:flavin reductase family protein n=1 Tax=unclassified Modicisalibacter TaxID=2679913 RepID=UPI001CCC793C|nr:MULTISPECIES: flavin reductase family protein [unclassified Modicisalibacter]MBZ9557729.1 flavin reductase family protein [Modicisalibacter sp. R2A 31.J]MBZ9573607.1 flavin reductase family protein [Modicisalibacter sp. MOD 31.J]